MASETDATWLIPVAFVAGWYFGGKYSETNTEAVYGGQLHLPVNCRALVQANIDGLRSGTYNVPAVLDSLERNCGAHGGLWGADEDE